MINRKGVPWLFQFMMVLGKKEYFADCASYDVVYKKSVENVWKMCDSRMPTFKYLLRNMIMGPHWIWLFTISGLCMSTYPPLPPPKKKSFLKKSNTWGVPSGGGGLFVRGFDTYINIHLWRFFPLECYRFARVHYYHDGDNWTRDECMWY